MAAATGVAADRGGATECSGTAAAAAGGGPAAAVTSAWKREFASLSGGGTAAVAGSGLLRQAELQHQLETSCLRNATTNLK